MRQPLPVLKKMLFNKGHVKKPTSLDMHMHYYINHNSQKIRQIVKPLLGKTLDQFHPAENLVKKYNFSIDSVYSDFLSESKGRLDVDRPLTTASKRLVSPLSNG